MLPLTITVTELSLYKPLNSVKSLNSHKTTEVRNNAIPDSSTREQRISQQPVYMFVNTSLQKLTSL